MRLLILRRIRGLKRLLIALILGLTPVVLGVGALYVEAFNTLQGNTRLAAGEALRQIEEVLGIADQATRDALPLAGQSCEKVQTALRQEAASLLFVRSVSLSRGTRLYCSSIFGPFEEEVPALESSQIHVSLLAGNHVTPDSPVLYYQRGNPQAGVLSVVDGRYLSTILYYVDPGAHLTLRISDRWLDARGEVYASQPGDFPVAQASRTSGHYPVSVSAGLSRGAVMKYIGEQLQVLLMLFVLLGVICGLASYWLLGRKTSLRRALRHAIRAGEIVPYLQPLVSNQTGRWEGIEVLARWQHPRDGLIAPNLFIPYAEHSGLIIELTRSLMSQVAEALPEFHAALPEGFHIGFNISEKHCHGGELIDDCAAFLKAFPEGAITLTLEITERELIASNEQTTQLFEALDEMGVKVALDDFGTGHSSLDYVRKFKVDYLKIDQSFIAMIGQDALSNHLLENILDLAERIDLMVVAEGIETAEQRDYLKTRAVDYLQGYYFSRPMPLEAFLTHVRTTPINEPGLSTCEGY